jgi:hypothetical protein
LGLGLVLSGCSSAPSEVSPEEKRNNFDLCVLESTSPFLAEEDFNYRLRAMRYKCRIELE